jgi:ribonuclease-3
MPSSLGELENLLGYRFKEISLLERAVTHRSWAYENARPADDLNPRPDQNETLEFVGDSVLGLAIAEQLYIRNPEKGEGDLTLMKHRLVSSDMLAEIARGLGLGEFVKLGRGEEKSGGRERRTVLANAFEAIIGAVFFDGGYIEARALINRLFANDLREVTPSSSLDYKTLLQEMLQAQKRRAPVYNLVRTEGPSHERRFWVEAVWDSGSATGTGVSIKSAEMEAANSAIKTLNSKAKEQTRN